MVVWCSSVFRSLPKCMPQSRALLWCVHCKWRHAGLNNTSMWEIGFFGFSRVNLPLTRWLVLLFCQIDFCTCLKANEQKKKKKFKLLLPLTQQLQCRVSLCPTYIGFWASNSTPTALLLSFPLPIFVIPFRKAFLISCPYLQGKECILTTTLLQFPCMSNPAHATSVSPQTLQHVLLLSPLHSAWIMIPP